MKNIKKVLCLTLALAMVFTITCTTAFATDDDDHQMPEGLIGHTIEIAVEPGEDAGIMPLIWGQTYPAVGNVTTKTSEFVVPERYFGYEAAATDRATGGSVDGGYCLIEFYKGCGSPSNMSIPINGKTYKDDWIDLHESNSTCYFKLTNNSDAIINVLITYYSWA